MFSFSEQSDCCSHVDISSDEEEGTVSYWVPDLLLEESDRKILEGSGWLNDKIINSYQKLLKKKYAGVTGLQSTLYCEDLKCKPEHSQKLVQVIHVGKCHWACISTIGCAKGAVSVMDSLYPMLPHKAVQQVAAILKHKGASFDLVYEDVDLQPNGADCGLYSLAFATTLCSGDDPVKLHYHNDQMRSHLIKCLENGVAEPFPATKHSARRPRGIQTVEVYCDCRLPEGNAKMIQCIACREWFHQHCETVPQTVWKRRHPKWKCCTCNA